MSRGICVLIGCLVVIFSHTSVFASQELSKDELIKVKNNQRFSVTNSNYVVNGTRFSKIYDNTLKRERLVKDSFIVQFKDNILGDDIDYYLGRKNLEIVSDLGNNTYVCKLVEHSSKSLVRFLNRTNGQRLEEESPDYEYDDYALNSLVKAFDVNEYKKVSTADLYTDPLANKQWHLENDGENGLVPGSDINIEGAWDYTRGAGIKVAVIDTGFDTGHPDINYYHSGYNALAGSDEFFSIEETGSFELAKAPRNSSENHGTAVAGIIAGKDNSSGVVGVAPEVEIIPIRLIDDNGQVSVAQIIAAFRKADELGAKIINNSWGSFDPDLEEGQLHNISDAERDLYVDIAKNGNNGNGIIVIFASGNSGKPNFNNSPEARIPEILSVGATDSTDQRVSYSVFGPELDIVAPGGGARPIYTTDRRDKMRKTDDGIKRKVVGYSKGSIARSFRGTSAAAPVVAGVAALVWSINPALNANQVKEIMLNTAYKSPKEKYEFVDGRNLELGYGRVDAAKAVEAAMQSFY